MKVTLIVTAALLAGILLEAGAIIAALEAALKPLFHVLGVPGF